MRNLQTILRVAHVCSLLTSNMQKQELKKLFSSEICLRSLSNQISILIDFEVRNSKMKLVFGKLQR